AALPAAVRHLHAGQLQRSEALCREVLEARPDHHAALHLLGVVMHRMGRKEAAVELIGKAVALRPDYAEAHNGLGNVLAEMGRLGEAAAAYRMTVAVKPGYAEAHCNLGTTLSELGEFDEAAAALEKAIALKPDLAQAHNNLGIVLQKQEKFADAASSCRRAIAINPKLAEAHNNLGSALKDLGRFDEAVAACRKAIALKRNFAEAHTNLGNALKEQRKLAEAVAAQRKAIALKPDYAEAHNNLGNALKEQGKLDEAIAAYDRALAVDPDYAEARFGRAVVHLLRGNFAAGWRDYMARRSMKRAGPEVHREPLGPELAGKRVLVVKDQGLGDEIFLLRFAPRLEARGATISYLADPRIAAMVGRLPFIARLAGPEEGPGTFDLVLSVGDLPYLLGMNEERDIPPSTELSVLPERLAEIRARLSSLGPPPYIGVTWRAGTQETGRLSKIAPLERLAAGLRPAGGTVVAVQRNPAAGEIEAFAGALGRDAHDLTALNDDLEGMLALVDLLDDYVCVSNLNVQLRAARGRASRVLIPNPPEFRWMAAGEESPWFPGTPLYRQTADGDWDRAFAVLARDLAAAWPAG
ncbi:MAG: tetratricopeptide repeat protein, partial [Proteobacteria bacterium]|nr:tetratricopeptide repeat protein [Pseudomonadota bacterium]